MSVSGCFSSVVRRVWRLQGAHMGFSYERVRVWLGCFSLYFIATLLLTACSGLNFGGGNGSGGATSTAAPSSVVALAQLHWCGKPLQIFRDEGATTATSTGTPSATPTTAVATPSATVGTTPTASSVATPISDTPTPTTITDWSQVQPQLGFTVYLPASLPRDTCLTSASGTIHDPIFGGSFSIGYLLPDHSAVTLSEAPARSQNSPFQCSTAATGATGGTAKTGTPTPVAGASTTPLQVCTGTRDTTNIVFSARGTQTKLEQFFNALQPNVVWVPRG